MIRTMIAAVVSIILLSGVRVYAGSDPVVIAVPRTVSSIPALEISGAEFSGKKISCRFYDDHIVAMSEFVSGRIPFFVTGFSQGLANYRAGGKIVLAGNFIWGMSSLVAREPLSSIGDFKGKTILVPFAGSPLDVQIRAIIRLSGFEKNISIMYAPIQQQIPLITAGKAQGGCLPEPFPSKFVSGKKGFRVFSFPDEWGRINGGERRTPQVSLFVKRDYFAANRKFVKEVVSALAAKCASVQKNRVALSGKYAETFGLDAKDLSSSISFVIYEIPSPEEERGLIRKYQSFIGDNDPVGDDFFR
jgi:ABC-type nitrate/sulfonate/bicarbonate transport system substrate-binding protein